MKSLQLTFNCFQFTESFTRKGRKSTALKSKSKSPSISMCHIILVCQCEQLPRASRRWHRRAIPLPGLLLHYNLAHKQSYKEKGGWRLVSSPSRYQGNLGQVMFVRTGIPKSIDFWELISVSKQDFDLLLVLYWSWKLLLLLWLYYKYYKPGRCLKLS